MKPEHLKKTSVLQLLKVTFLIMLIKGVDMNLTEATGNMDSVQDNSFYCYFGKVVYTDSWNLLFNICKFILNPLNHDVLESSSESLYSIWKNPYHKHVLNDIVSGEFL